MNKMVRIIPINGRSIENFIGARPWVGSWIAVHRMETGVKLYVARYLPREVLPKSYDIVSAINNTIY